MEKAVFEPRVLRIGMILVVFGVAKASAKISSVQRCFVDTDLAATLQSVKRHTRITVSHYFPFSCPVFVNVAFVVFLAILFFDPVCAAFLSCFSRLSPCFMLFVSRLLFRDVALLS